MKISWQIAPAIILTGILCYGLHSCDVNKTAQAHEKALKDQKIELEGQCLSSKLFSSGVADENAQAHTAIDHRYDSLVMRGDVSAACIPILDSPAIGSVHDTTTQPIVSGSRGVTAVSILKILKDADNVAADLRSCQKYATEVKRIVTGQQK